MCTYIHTYIQRETQRERESERARERASERARESERARKRHIGTVDFPLPYAARKQDDLREKKSFFTVTTRHILHYIYYDVLRGSPPSVRSKRAR